MAAVYSELDERLIKFIAGQPMFFVATAPCLDDSGGGGHVNLSPKGYRDTFAVLDPLTVAYLDLTGTGAETIAHLRQNGRITIMFCSFAREPKILRIYGTGLVVVPGDPRWDEFAGSFPLLLADAGAGGGDGELVPARTGLGTGTDRGQRRAIIVVNIDRIADSCGYAVPRMELVEERDLLDRWAERKSPDDLAAYRVKHNSASIDGLPALG
ncbi:MAG TPA: pyridoxamine 5'-phosphate oxidase family protein [Streptosporangiaceae bacterium]|nr:pyridoxamine 5'-phosphate oxidase family protein [Streptosporangiaceae bacterium]